MSTLGGGNERGFRVQSIPHDSCVVLRIPLPLTILQILAIDLGTDIVPALGLGAEPPEAGVMQRPPRSAEYRLVDRFLLFRAYLFLGLMEAGAAMSACFFVLRSSGGYWSEMLAVHVVRVAFENAVSIASVRLLTDATMTEVPESKPDSEAGRINQEL